MSPPAAYLQEVPEPGMTGKTIADLTQWAVELRAALKVANGDKMKLREWLAETPGDGVLFRP